MKWLVLGHQGASARVAGVGREGTGQTSDPLPFPTEFRSSPSLGSCQLSGYLSVLSPPPGAQEAQSDCLLRSAILWTLLMLLCPHPGIFRCLWPDWHEAFLKREGPLRLPLDEELLTVKKMDAQRAAFSFTKWWNGNTWKNLTCSCPQGGISCRRILGTRKALAQVNPNASRDSPQNYWIPEFLRIIKPKQILRKIY